jgi:carbamoyltransferase
MSTKYVVLGLNHGSHDTSACLMIDGELIAACEEERFNKQKHTREFPINAINDCLKQSNLSIKDIDEITFSFNQNLLEINNFDNLAPNIKNRFKINDLEKLRNLREVDINLENSIRKKLNFSGKITSHLHHLSHLASSYYPSGFDESLIISHDGVGEINCSLMATASNGVISVFHHGNPWPHSLGLLYAAITEYLGWRYSSDEGIVMGLAPFGDDTKKIKSGEQTYQEIFQQIIYPIGDFDYEIDKTWITFHEIRGKWISDKFLNTFGPKRIPEGDVEEHHKNIACALQNRLEEIILLQLKKCKEKFKLKKLCFAGGLALNCSLNGKIVESKLFDEIFVQPASGDNGTAIGACYLSTKNKIPELKSVRSNNYYIGSKFTNEQIREVLQKKNINFFKPKNLFDYVAKCIKQQKIIGWFQDGAEFGPRALGNRSILTSPFPKEMKDILNSKVKFREEFRPFAPAILSEFVDEYFIINQSSPHMLIAVTVKSEKISEIPAVVHVDNSARVQTVNKTDNPKFRNLIESFYNETKCPVLLNTSFNVKGQPIVNSPEDAIDCFLSTNIDILAIGDFVAIKDQQQ